MLADYTKILKVGYCHKHLKVSQPAQTAVASSLCLHPTHITIHLQPLVQVEI